VSRRFLENYCRANGQRESGIRRKESALKTWILPALGNKRLNAIGEEDVQRSGPIRISDEPVPSALIATSA
jgi:hypothetical protein